MSVIHTATLIIRSAGERTVELCKKLIQEQEVPEPQIFVVQEVPFSAAMRKSFEIGLREGRKWTFCVDADVLLRPNSIAHMISEAEKQPENVCEIQGLIIDKFFGGPRPAGAHLFRTSLLPEVIARIPEEGVNIRPEYHTLQSMTADGYPWVEIPYIVGTHDDEQYNRDIYRKCFVHAVKHLSLASLFIPLWKRNAAHDADFQVALTAFSDSIKHTGEVYINTTQSVYADGFRRTDMPEKDTLKTELIDLETIERTIQQWVEAPEYMERFPSKFGLNKKSRATVTKCVCDLQEQCVQEVLIYGSGQAGEELYDALLETNIVVRGFIDSTASSHALAPDGNPPMLPETALEKYPGVDVVIASISYRNPMLHRLLQAGLNGRRVWVI